MDNPVKAKIRQAGGQTAVSRALGVPVTTVHAWGVSGKVPPWRAEQFDSALAAIAAQAVAA